jgi:hypothetical protein
MRSDASRDAQTRIDGVAHSMLIEFETSETVAFQATEEEAPRDKAPVVSPVEE